MKYSRHAVVVCYSYAVYRSVLRKQEPNLSGYAHKECGAFHLYRKPYQEFVPSPRFQLPPSRCVFVRSSSTGADTITADKAGNTPLHYASKGGYSEMVKMLVGQGAAVEKRNGSSLTPYDVATDHVVRQYLLPLQLRVSGRQIYRIVGRICSEYQ